MRVLSVVVVAVAVAFGVAVAQEEPLVGDQAKVNLTARAQPVQTVAEEITEQTGVQVAVTATTESTLTGKLEDRTVEEAVKLLAEGARASWMRAYVLELAPPEEPCTAAMLLSELNRTRNRWIDSLSDEQRQQLLGRIVSRFDSPEQAAGDGAPAEQPTGEMRHVFGEMLAGPGGGVAVARTPEGVAEGDWQMMMRYDDPIMRLLLPERSDSITLDLTDAPRADVLSAFTMAARFLVVADEQIEGTLTLKLEDAPLSTALDAIAAATGAQWRTVYVIGQPRPLTEEEIARGEEQREQQFMQLWAQFWERPQEERARWIQIGAAGIEQIGERMRNASPERRELLKNVTERVFDFMIGYSTQLSPDQRLEIKPVLQALARMRAAPEG